MKHFTQHHDLVGRIECTPHICHAHDPYREDILEVIEGKSKGYQITHMDCMDKVCKMNVDAITKVVKLRMKQNMGLLTSNKISSSIRDPLCTLCEVSNVCVQVFHIQ
jgi:hypothetical protein